MKPRHLLFQPLDLLLEPRRLVQDRIRRLLPVGAVELAQIAIHALLDLRHPPRHLGMREVPVAVVHRLELAAIHRDARALQETHRPAQPHKPRADLADRGAAILPEVSDRLVVRRKSSKQPHHLDIAPGFPFQSTARLNPVEVAVNVELQQDGGMIGRPARCLRSDPVEPQAAQIKRLDESVDHVDGIVVANPVGQAFGQKGYLRTVGTFDKSTHPIPRLPTREPYLTRPFSHSQGQGTNPLAREGAASMLAGTRQR